MAFGKNFGLGNFINPFKKKETVKETENRDVTVEPTEAHNSEHERIIPYQIVNREKIVNNEKIVNKTQIVESHLKIIDTNNGINGEKIDDENTLQSIDKSDEENFDTNGSKDSEHLSDLRKQITEAKITYQQQQDNPEMDPGGLNLRTTDSIMTGRVLREKVEKLEEEAKALELKIAKEAIEKEKVQQLEKVADLAKKQ